MTRRALHHDWLCSVSFSFKLTMLIFSCNTVLNITMVISHLLHEETGSDRDEMCGWACSLTIRDHVRSDDIRERLKVENITERCRKARLK